jgi:hypothetical protein
MFDKIARCAETLATSAGQSRRGFLGRLGQAALGTAGVLGGLLVLPNKARADKKCDRYECGYSCPGIERVVYECGGCPADLFPGCTVNYSHIVCDGCCRC